MCTCLTEVWFCFVSVVVTWFYIWIFSFRNCWRNFYFLFLQWRDGYRGAKYSNPTL